MASANVGLYSIKLTQALRDFEDSLFREASDRLYSEGLPPPIAVFELASTIDRRCIDNRQPCLGPALVPTLSFIQFSSHCLSRAHPITAAGLWGALKLTILITTNESTNFESFLRAIGDESPRVILHDFFDLFYQSFDVQEALDDYLVSVIQLCKCRIGISGVSRNPVHLQPLLSESRIAWHGENIKVLAQRVHNEASLASLRQQRMQFESSNSHLLLEEEERLNREKSHALNSLSTYDYQSAFQQIKRQQVPNTWQYIIHNPEFHKWMVGSSQCLWLTGEFSMVKSMICAHVVSHLLTGSRLEKGDLVSFFFCQYGEVGSFQCETETILGSILKQLVSDLPAQIFKNFPRNTHSRKALVDFVRSALSTTNRYFIILDCLRNCEEREVIAVVEMFHDLASSGLPLKILFASRPDLPGQLLNKFPAQQRISLDDGETLLQVTADFHKIVQVQERTLGAGNEDSRIKYELGKMLYEQQKYVEAEQLFRQVFQRDKNVRGAEHRCTIDCEYQLSCTLFQQQKYVEAEQHFRQVLQKDEAHLGAEQRTTVGSRQFLGRTLFKQQKFVEAEQLFRQVLQSGEKDLGAEHRTTIDYKYHLGRTLFMRQKYLESEQLLRYVVQRDEKDLGAEHDSTNKSRYSLGHTLLSQQKHVEAEQLFRQVLQEGKFVMGAEDGITVGSKYGLGYALSKQQKYVEAEQLLRHVVQRDEKDLGTEHEKTLRAKHQLGFTLYQQHKYIEAERLLRQAVQGSEKLLGAEHERTIESKLVLQETVLKLAPLAAADVDMRNTVYSDLDKLFVDRRAKYNDAEIGQISLLLHHLDSAWGRIPRTYTILRILNCEDHLDDFISLGFTDHWFPFTEKTLPSNLSPTQRREFITIQHLVITQSLDLEKGDKGQHAFFGRDDTLPFEQKGILGSGGFGQVDKVLSLISHKEYARKRVSRTRAFGGRPTQAIKQFIAEIDILKRLKHHHIVEFIGSYADPKYIGLIMSPVANTDLSKYLGKIAPAQHGELRTYFGCLARALEFLHEQRVRHKDIKPSNVLIHGGNILFTDFGLSLDFTALDSSTTTSMANGITQRYCAPEVARQESRNTASDVWSLGLVFLEMVVVLKEKPVEYIKKFFKTHGNGQDFVRTNPDALVELVAELKETVDESDDRVFGWLQSMLQEQQKLRPTAAALASSIVFPSKPADGDGRYCGICCVEPDDEVAEIVDDFEDHLRI